jgi:NAD(P)-dependent dehydrogenase (short-subunit alcohol dehydrogenase family)
MVTGVVNNAGVTAHIGDLADTPVEVIRRVVEVNLLGVILCARQASKVMSVRRGGQGGAIVNVSSAAATLGAPHEYPLRRRQGGCRGTHRRPGQGTRQ